LQLVQGSFGIPDVRKSIDWKPAGADTSRPRVVVEEEKEEEEAEEAEEAAEEEVGVQSVKASICVIYTFYTYMHASVCVRVCVCAFVCVCVRARALLCMYVCVCTGILLARVQT